MKLPKAIQVTVTKRHIERGQRRLTDSCPIALALQERFFAPKVWPVWNRDVGNVDVEIATGERLYFVLPKRANRWAQDFDAGNPVKPTTFRLPRRV